MDLTLNLGNTKDRLNQPQLHLSTTFEAALDDSITSSLTFSQAHSILEKKDHLHSNQQLSSRGSSFFDISSRLWNVGPKDLSSNVVHRLGVLWDHELDVQTQKSLSSSQSNTNDSRLNSQHSESNGSSRSDLSREISSIEENVDQIDSDMEFNPRLRPYDDDQNQNIELDADVNQSQTNDDGSGNNRNRPWFDAESANYPSLWKVLWKFLGQEFALSSAWNLLSLITLLVGPLVMPTIVGYVHYGSSHSSAIRSISLAILAAVALIVHSLSKNQSTFKAARLALNLKTGLSGLVYSKSLRLKNSKSSQRHSSDNPSAQNTYAPHPNDCSKLLKYEIPLIDSFISSFNMLWGAPLIFILSLIILWTKFGASTIVGCLVFIALLSISSLISWKSQKLEQDIRDIQAQEQHFLREWFQNFKIIKLLCLEGYVSHLIGIIQNDKNSVVSDSKVRWTIAQLIWSTSSMVASLTTLFTFTIIAGNLMSLENFFLCIIVFTINKQPLSYLPLLVVQTIRAHVAVNKIGLYLLEEELDIFEENNRVLACARFAILTSKYKVQLQVPRVPQSSTLKQISSIPSPKENKYGGFYEPHGDLNQDSDLTIYEEKDRLPKKAKVHKTSELELREHFIRSPSKPLVSPQSPFSTPSKSRNSSRLSQVIRVSPAEQIRLNKACFSWIPQFAASNNSALSNHPEISSSMFGLAESHYDIEGLPHFVERNERVPGGGRPNLKDITFSAKSGNLVVVSGAIGSGKSSLLHALLGEMKLLDGTADIEGSISYASQSPWILNESIRFNITFTHNPSNMDRYKHILNITGVARDTEYLKEGDMTVIGNAPGALDISDEQKSRISLARALFRDSDIYIIDDLFSTFESTGLISQIMDTAVIKGLAGKTRVFASNHPTALKHADLIIYMKNGQIERMGSYQSLSVSDPEVFELIQSENKLGRELKRLSRQDSFFADSSSSNDLNGSSSVIDQYKKSIHKHKRSNSSLLDSAAKINFQQPFPRQDIHHLENDSETYNEDYLQSVAYESDSSSDEEEIVDSGENPEIVELDDEVSLTDDQSERSDSIDYQNRNRRISSASDRPASRSFKLHYNSCNYYIRKLGRIHFGLISTILFALIFLEIFRLLNLGIWIENHPLSVDMTKNARKVQGPAIAGFIILSITSLSLLYFAQWLLNSASMSASTLIHKDLMNSFLHSPVWYLLGNQKQKLINLHSRFTFDFHVLQSSLPLNLQSLAYSMLDLFKIIIMMLFSSPLVGLVFIPITFLVMKLHANAYKPLNLISRLILYETNAVETQCVETSDGVVTIRAYEAEEQFLTEFNSRMDAANKPMLASFVLHRYVSLRISILSCLVIFASWLSGIILSMFGWTTGALFGVSFIFALQLPDLLPPLLHQVSELIHQLKSIRRIKDDIMSCPSEESKSFEGEEGSWRASKRIWPSNGEIAFHSVTTIQPSSRKSSSSSSSSPKFLLKNVSFEIKSGSIVAFTGSEGSGKSNILHALMRFSEMDYNNSAIEYEDSIDMPSSSSSYKPSSSRSPIPSSSSSSIPSSKSSKSSSSSFIEIDLTDISQVSIETLRQSISVVPSDPVLLTSSFRQFLDPFSDCAESKLWEALDRFKLKEKILMSSSLKLDTVISPNLHSSSNSTDIHTFNTYERQLLSLARSWCSGNKILVFQQAKQKMNQNEQNTLMQVITENFEGITIIIIAKDDAFNQICDVIFEMKDEKVFEKREKKTNQLIII